MMNHYSFDDLANLSEEEQSICASNDVRFLTNFDAEKEYLYLKAAKWTNTRIYIGTNCYDNRGRQYDDGQHSKALYVGNDVNDLARFWAVFDSLSNNGM